MSWVTKTLGIDKLFHDHPDIKAAVKPVEDALKTLEKPAYDLLTSTWNTRVAGAAQSALHTALVAAETEVGKVQGIVTHAILGSVGTVLPGQAQIIAESVNSVVTSAEHWAEANAPKVVANLIGVLATKLGIA